MPIAFASTLSRRWLTACSKCCANLTTKKANIDIHTRHRPQPVVLVPNRIAAATIVATRFVRGRCLKSLDPIEMPSHTITTATTSTVVLAMGAALATSDVTAASVVNRKGSCVRITPVATLRRMPNTTPSLRRRRASGLA